jgi:hypothetical protein
MSVMMDRDVLELHAQLSYPMERSVSPGLTRRGRRHCLLAGTHSWIRLHRPDQVHRFLDWHSQVSAGREADVPSGPEVEYGVGLEISGQSCMLGESGVEIESPLGRAQKRP